MIYTIAEFRKNTRRILDSIDQGADVQIQRYEKLYAINIAQNKALLVEAETTKAGQSMPQTSKRIADAQKRIDVATRKIADDGLKKLKKIRADVAIPDSCPHGYAKGFCKKSDCSVAGSKR